VHGLSSTSSTSASSAHFSAKAQIFFFQIKQTKVQQNSLSALILLAMLELRRAPFVSNTHRHEP